MIEENKKPNTIEMEVGGTQLSKSGGDVERWRDPYTLAVTCGWPAFFAGLFIVEICVNLVFAGLYLLGDGAIANARPGSLADAFFFSVETLATVGYGEMAPATIYGHAISSLEILCGMTVTALVTGLIFVRFSKPRSSISFAEQAVIGQHDGKPTLMIRLANARPTQLADARARLTVLIRERTVEGRLYRRAYDLKLTQPRLPSFLLTWTLMHEIDAESPLHGFGPDACADAEILVILTVEARDLSVTAEIFATKTYAFDRIMFGMAYQDTVSYVNGRTHADLAKLSAIEPDVVHDRRRHPDEGAGVA